MSVHRQAASACRNLAGNAELCNPPAGMQLPSSLPVCSPQTLDAQKRADPAAVTITASPPTTPSLAVTALGPPSPDNGGDTAGATLILLWPFLGIAVFGLLAIILMLFRRRQHQVGVFSLVQSRGSVCSSDF